MSAQLSSLGNDTVSVLCRVRPSNNAESKSKDCTVVVNSNEILLTSCDKKYEFDHVFDKSTTQRDVFNQVRERSIRQVFDGYNATIFAYGQTGSGKSFTMTGYSPVQSNDNLYHASASLWNKPEDMGLVPRLIEEVFKEIKKRAVSSAEKFTLQMSYCELYLERVRDLIDPKKTDLKVRESRDKGVYIDGVTTPYIPSFDEAIRIMRRGELNRTVAATDMNKMSSRSHSILIFTLTSEDSGLKVKRTSRMVFVDLAGSEKQKKTGATGTRLKEANATNKSLTTLGVVIRSLVEGKPHIPYRDSKLTRILSESLGGNSRTTVIVTCSPSLLNCEETKSTLMFGHNTKRVRNRAVINAESSDRAYKGMYLSLLEEVKIIKQSLEDVREENSKLQGACASSGVRVVQGTGDATVMKEIADLRRDLLNERDLRQRDIDELTQLRDIQGVADEMEMEFNDQKMLIKELRDTIISLEDQMRELKSDLVESRRMLDRSHEMMSVYKAEADQSHADRHELAESETGARRIADATTTKVEILERMLRESNEHYSAEINRQRQQIHTLKGKIAQLSSR